MPEGPAFAPLPRRPFGKTGIELSIIGFGGIVVMDATQQRANEIVAEAVDFGVNYFDVAPTYGDAEEKLGAALRSHRDKVFLAGKTTCRAAGDARREFEQSLTRLHTDRLDLYQLHGLADVAKDVEAAFASGGVMEMIEEEKQRGRIRFVGFSAHTVEAALAALDRHAFDSVLLPVNFVLWMREDFGPQVLESAARRGTAVLALKAMAWGEWQEGDPRRAKYPKCWYEPIEEPRLQDLALRWTLSRPVVATIPPGEESLWRRAVRIGRNFRPVTPHEEAELRRNAAEREPIFHRQEKRR